MIIEGRLLNEPRIHIHTSYRKPGKETLRYLRSPIQTQFRLLHVGPQKTKQVLHPESKAQEEGMPDIIFVALGLQIAQNRSYLCTLGPKVGIIYILGALG